MLKQISAKTKRAALSVRRMGHRLFGEPFITHPEKSLYRQIAAMPENHIDRPIFTFRPKCLGGHPVLCRSGTRDKSSLEDLLFYQTYLPPTEIDRPKVIVAVGTNVGYTVAHFAFLYPGARIIGVELDADNFLLAQQNTTWCNERVTLINAAIWSSDGYVNFEGHGEDAYHVVASADAVVENVKTATNRRARSMTMESLIEDFNIARIDYLKMDIEGAEAEIILATNPTWLDRVGAMKIELHDVDYNDFYQALISRGFRCHPDGRHPSCIVAVRRPS